MPPFTETAPALEDLLVDDPYWTATCSFAQQRLWFLDQFEPGSAVYNIADALRFSGPLDVRVLARSFNEVVRRHEALRTTFDQVDEVPVQVIADELEVTLPLVDLSALDTARQEEEVRRRAGEEANGGFDLRRGPLVRGRVLRLGEEEHVVLVTMHHIISDGWSMGVLIRELSELYGAYSTGQVSPLPEIDVQYADYAQWQQDRLQGDELERQMSYWKRQLGGAAPVLELPSDHARPAVRTYRGAAESFELSEPVSAALSRLSCNEGVTLYMTLLGAFQVLLGRYAGVDDVVVGSPIAGRTRSELEGLIGFFVNTLVMRTDLSGRLTVRELLARVREVALSAYAHQDVPFEKLVEELEPERSLAHHPLFQVMFILQNTAREALALPGLAVRPLAEDSTVAKFDLLLSMSESGGRLRGFFEFNTDLFERSTIRRMTHNFATLLEGMVADPETLVAQLPLVAEAERRRMLVDWNATAADYPSQKCLQELFEDQAERTPAAVAVTFEDAALSYAELDRRSNQLAQHLRRLGVGPEVPVAISVERSLGMVVGLVGILKAGGAYVPLDPQYPRERLAFMLEDSGARVLVTQEQLVGALPAPPSGVVCLDRDGDEIACHGAEPPRSGVAAENLAYVIYTSGSTGRPKGVQISHRSLVNFVVDMGRRFEIGAPDRLLSVTTLSFDIFGLELYVPLTCGAEVRVASREATLDGSLLAATLAETKATVMQSTPATWRLLLASGWRGQEGLKLLSGGEALSGDLASQLLDKGEGLWNLCGPTETTIWSALHEVGEAREPMPIGRAISNTELYVLDCGLRPVPAGVAGELYIGGDGLARGYLGRESLTAEKLVPNPFAGDGTRLYRTGDLARYLPDGNLEFLGRIDHQVKVRGFRIELGEIETVLDQDEGVAQSVVVAREDEPGEKRLVAYLVGRDGETPRVSRLRAHLASTLPEYMVPSAFVVLERIPLTPNGKVDRQALPSPAGTPVHSERGYVAPRTPAEEVLAAIWAEVLRLERVGVHDPFFKIGGHSLVATRVLGRVRDAFAVELPLRAVFEHPTVAGLAEQVEAALGSEGRAVLPPLTRAPRDGDLPLSYTQQRLWFLEQFEPGGATYNIPAGIRVRGPLDVGALELSVAELARRHESLRTTFELVDGAPVQVISEEAGVSVPVIDLSALEAGLGEAEIRRRATEEAARGFDLRRGPLLRVQVLRAAEDHVVLLTMHHIIADGWSAGVVIHEISKLYEAFVSGRTSPLPELDLQYADFAQWQRGWLEGEVLERQLSYWRERLGGLAPVLRLPTDRPRPALSSHRGAIESFELSEATSASLVKLGRREGVTLYMTLLAGLQALLSRYSGEHDVAVGSPIAGRAHTELEGLIGAFVNTLVMRTDLSGNPTVRELLRRVREVALGAYTHQDVPFEKLVEDLKPERSLAHHPLFQVMFVLQNAPQEELRSAKLTFRPMAGDLAAAKFDLLVSIHEAAGRLRGTIQYRTDLFDRDTVRRMATHFTRLAAGMAADPEARVTDLPILTEPERRQLVAGWNDTAAPYPSQTSIHELFESQADRTPGAAAVVFEGTEMTYAALEERANRLAHHLRGRGVGPESRVGICMERSLEMVVALLAILKAGGAYVPLDPEYPRRRLAYVLEDSDAAVLLTEERLLGQLPETSATVLCLDREGPVIARAPSTRPRSGVDASDLAYVLYTSGSTGRPKGVANTHRGVVNLLSWLQETFALTAEDRVAQKTTYAFDVSVWEVFWPLAAGARMVLARPGGQRDRDYLVEWIAAEGITVMHFVPSVLELLLAGEGLRRSAALRLVLCGGEVLPRRLERRLAEDCPGARRYNMYGPTEASVDATAWRCRDDWEGESLPIGRPIANMVAHVLDPRLNPVPIGVAGELVLGGAGLARGYAKRPGLTARRFVPDPFATAAGTRLYRTGDLVRRLGAGDLEFLGRIDDQVKVRGFRLELGEIEAVLEQHAGVSQAALVVREDPPGTKRLVAYVVGRDGASAPGVSELRAHLSASLPEYMVPSAFVELERLPLLPNGKLDRAALPAPEGARPELEGAYTAPRSEPERVLAEIWAEVLRLERVGVDDNFFELGGDSILCFQVMARAREAGYHVTLKQIFQDQTIARLASVARPVERLEAQQDRVTGPAPLTPIQTWFFEQEPVDPHFFNQAVLLELKERIDAAALASAVAALVHHHDALRLRFERDGESWSQFHAEEDGNPVLAWVDLSNVADPRAGLEAEATAVQSSLDVATGPLLRVVHFDLGAAGERLLLVIHHLAVDGVSWRVLLEDLQRAYEQARRGQAPDLPPKTTSFQEWSKRLAAYADSEALRAEEAYWTSEAWQRVSGLPVDEPWGVNTVASAGNVSVCLDADRTRQLLQDVPGVYRTQINDVLLAALAHTLAGWTGSSRVLVELEGHGREDLFDDVDLSRTVGWFTSLYPMLLDVDGCEGPGELLKSVKEQVRRLPNHGIGHGVLRWLSRGEPGHRLRELPRAEVRFNYLGQFDQVLSESGPFRAARESSGESRSPRGRRPCLIDVNALVLEESLRLDWTYSEALHRRATIEAVAEEFVRTLTELIEHCLSPEAGGYTPSDFPLASLDEESLQRVAALLG